VTRSVFLLCLVSLLLPAFGTSRPQLYIKDGQVTCYKFQVFVQGLDLTEDNLPLLSFEIIHLFRQDNELGVDLGNISGNQDMTTTWRDLKGWIKPDDVYPNQNHVFEEDGKQIPLQGTLLLFDLEKTVGAEVASIDPERVEVILGDTIQPVVRVIPRLIYFTADANGNQTVRNKLTTNPIYVGSRWRGFCWALFAVLITVGVIVLISWRSGNALGVLKSSAGNYSLARIQVCAWTIAVGWTVIAEGLLQLTLPEIPHTLVVMMSLSLFTAVAQNTKENSQRAKTGKAPEDDAADGFIFDASTRTVSLPKVQMLFWTVLMIGMFLWKTLLEGDLWPIPQEMVVLMGASQGGFLVKDLGATNPPQSNPPQGSAAS